MKSKNKNFVEKIINYLLNILIVIFGIILLISIYTGVQTKILGNKYTNFFGYSIFEVQTGSMADTINAGDWIIVSLTQKVNLNEIVTYELGGEYVTHRVIEAYKGTYITKGDANNAKDEPVDQKQIIGKVTKILPNFGVIRKTLFNPSVLIAIIITLFLFNFAIKKSKAEDGKDKTTKLNKEEGIYMLFGAIVKKISQFFAKEKKIKSDEKPKIENKTLERQEDVPTPDKVKVTAPKVKVEEHYKDEDELDKTSFYRVIPVDSNEVDDKFKSAPTKAEVEEYYKDADELDKTSLYRIIPVDASEVDDTFLEIANNEIKETEQGGQNQKKKIDVEPKIEEKIEVEEPDGLTKLNLDLLKNIRSKKSKNTIDTVVLIKKEELNEVINVLVKDDKTYADKATVKDVFITTYIDAKYYNYYGDKDVEYDGKKSISRIEKVIKEVGSDLITDYLGKDTKYNDIVDIYEKYASIFILIANLEHARDSIADSKAKNQFYKKEVKKYAKDWDNKKIEYMTAEIIKIQKNYTVTVEYFLKKLETNMFNLNFNKLVTKKDVYGLELIHNITFSKVYSDYIIDKTYTEGIIAEDKMSVLLTLLSVQLIKDMILSSFDKKYVLYVPSSLYTKEKKFEKLLGMIDDKHAKDSVIILIKFKDLLNSRNIVKEVKRMGYKFALVFDIESEIKEKDRSNIYIADYIFVNKKAVNASKVLSFIPKELLGKVIYENIVDKVGDFGGE